MASERDVPGIDRVDIDRLPGGHGRLGRHDPTTVAVGAAAVAVVISLGRRLAVNGPVDLPWLVAVGPAVEGTAAVVTALAVILVGVRAGDRRTLVGLVAVGVFGLLATLSSAARLSAAGAVVAGGLVAVGPTLSGPRRLPAWGHTAVGAGVLGGALLALGAAMGTLPAGARAAGTLSFLFGLAASPLVVMPARPDWAVGGLVAAATVLVAATVPFVSGAALLVGWAVVGVPTVVVALGFGGVATAASWAVRRGRTVPAVGACLLFGAGVPSTTARAVAAVLGLALFLGATTTATTTTSTTTTTTGGVHE